jgi:predicted DCC family thiol-disulfide oxidoreductase YuxK
VAGTVIYDGSCGFCNRQVRFIRKLDRRRELCFLPSDSGKGREVMLAAGLAGTENDTVVYCARNRYYLRSSAVLNILRDIGRGWQLVYIFIIVPPFIRDFLYRLVAANRHRLSGRGERCGVV